jgi:hypothetical protein
MKAFLVVSLVLVFAFTALPLQTSKPIPPGIREADKLPGPADVPPLNQSRTNHPAPGLMRDQALELAELARSIPADVSQVSNGTLPKDMSEKLKRIEKLSKALRGEISR